MKRQGFSRMDVSTSIIRDPKLHAILAGDHPEHYAPAVVAYLAVTGLSWEQRARAPSRAAWPL